MTEKEVHAGQSNIRLGFVIAAPVLGRVEMATVAELAPVESHPCSHPQWV